MVKGSLSPVRVLQLVVGLLLSWQVFPVAQTAMAEKGLAGGGHEGSSSQGWLGLEGAGGFGSQSAASQVGGENAPMLCNGAKPLNVLFIGNSYTHYFDMPQLVAGMAESAGCEVKVRMVAPGGTRLARHAESGETLSAIGERDWDAVVLQNFSQLPSQPVDKVRQKTFPAVEKLVSVIRENDPTTAVFFYATWGRRDGDQQNCKNNSMVCSFRGHTAALQRGYSLYAEEFGGTIANVGGAWSRIAADRKSPFSYKELYDRDGSHPSLKGSYLAASVFFASLFRLSPEGLSYPAGLSETSARYIQRVAGLLPVSGA